MTDTEIKNQKLSNEEVSHRVGELWGDAHTEIVGGTAQAETQSK